MNVAVGSVLSGFITVPMTMLIKPREAMVEILISSTVKVLVVSS